MKPKYFEDNQGDSLSKSLTSLKIFVCGPYEEERVGRLQLISN